LNPHSFGSCLNPPQDSGIAANQLDRDRLGRLLMFPLGDVEAMRDSNLNSGYPITLLVMAMIETCTSVLYCQGAEACGEKVGRFFADYLAELYPEYSPAFGRGFKANAKQFGKLLYKYLRCKLAHDATAIRGFPVDARMDQYGEHLKADMDGSIKIHAYHFFDDFRSTLSLVAKRANEDHVFKTALDAGIQGYKARLHAQSMEVLSELRPAVKTMRKAT
jgi:hypothetical protein